MWIEGNWSCLVALGEILPSFWSSYHFQDGNIKTKYLTKESPTDWLQKDGQKKKHERLMLNIEILQMKHALSVTKQWAKRSKQTPFLIVWTYVLLVVLFWKNIIGISWNTSRDDNWKDDNQSGKDGCTHMSEQWAVLIWHNLKSQQLFCTPGIAALRLIDHEWLLHSW